MNKIKYTLMSLVMMASATQICHADKTDDAVKKAGSIIEQVRKRLAPDKRQVIYEVNARKGQGGKVVLDGEISEAVICDSLINSLRREGLDVYNSIYIYPADQWATPRISVACMRTGRSHAAEMASQALMGMPLRVLSHNSDWYRVQTPDGYIAWVTDSSLVPKTDDEMKRWRRSARYVVTAPYQTRAYASAKANGLREVVSDLVNGNIVIAVEGKSHNGRVQIELPDGRRGWVSESDVTPIEQWAAQDFDPQVILDQAYSMEGTPYLWGGTSIKSLDCSGLAKVSYLANGIILMRDASQQALTGKRIEAVDWKTCQPGDLLFFGNRDTGRVTHVAIYDHDGNYVHSSGRVKRNSVDPESESYLTTPFLHAVRIHGSEGTPGITYARWHPWYFDADDKHTLKE